MAEESDSRIVKLAQRLLEQTKAGRIQWDETDKEDSFIYTASNSSVVVKSRVDTDGDLNITLSFLNESGSQVAVMKSEWFDKPEWEEGYDPGPNNKLLESLHEAARRSALKVEEVLDTLFEDLR